jgi:hypothetical protein
MPKSCRTYYLLHSLDSTLYIHLLKGNTMKHSSKVVLTVAILSAFLAGCQRGEQGAPGSSGSSSGGSSMSGGSSGSGGTSGGGTAAICRHGHTWRHISLFSFPDCSIYSAAYRVLQHGSDFIGMLV